jgi:hypothetical protein
MGVFSEREIACALIERRRSLPLTRMTKLHDGLTHFAQGFKSRFYDNKKDELLE